MDFFLLVRMKNFIGFDLNIVFTDGERDREIER